VLYQDEPVRENRIRGLVERFLSRPETDDDEEDEDDENETEQKKARRKLSRRFLSMLGIKRDRVSETGEEIAQRERSLEPADEVRGWFEAALNNPESTEEESESTEATIDGDVVELPPPAEGFEPPAAETTRIYNQEDEVDEPTQELIIEHDVTEESVDVSTEEEPSIEEPETREENIFEEEPDPVVEQERLVRTEPVSNVSEVSERVTETEYANSGAAFAAFVAAERISAYRRNKTEAKTEESISQERKETDKKIDSLLEKQQELKKEVKKQKEANERITRATKDKQQEESLTKTEVIIERRETSYPKERPEVHQPQPQQRAERKSAEKVSKQSVEYAKTNRKPEAANSKREEGLEEDEPRKQKFEFAVPQEISAREEKRPVSFELYDESKHEIKDEPTDRKGATIATQYGGDQSYTTDGSVHGSKAQTAQKAPDRRHQDAASTSAQMRMYQQAILSGVVVAVIIIVVALAIMFLR
jgi:hypothetical protein